MDQGNTLKLLLVEDSEGDARLMEIALERAPIPTQLKVVPDGVEAMALLRQQAPYADAARPDLIFLDLNMPRKDGRAVLVEIKNDPDLKAIAVVILTTSEADRDIQFCCQSKCNAYLIKPAQLDEFFQLVQGAVVFWGKIIHNPTFNCADYGCLDGGEPFVKSPG